MAMTIRIDISPELESQLSAKAAAAGKDLAAFVLEVVESSVGNGTARPGLESPQNGRKSWDHFLATARAWTQNLPAGRRLDDSRESIYEGRGE